MPRGARWAGGTERTVHLRCVTTPDEAQKVLLNRLGLTLPLRLRRWIQHQALRQSRCCSGERAIPEALVGTMFVKEAYVLLNDVVEMTTTEA